MDQFFVYSLIDPRTNEIKYIGATIDPKTRLQAHTFGNQGAKKKLEWINELLSENLAPLMEIIEECPTSDLAAERELHHFNENNFGQLVCASPSVCRYKYSITSRPKKTPTSLSMTEHAVQLLKELADKKGVSQAAILEMLIREAAAKP